ncbi:MAG TPA: GyrI-like domain-containing protein [Candidatus Deferrimicrobium sp.]|nr:GyrI-like domain-containing protein [Candidatus Deferrimicrobium sp.]
MVQPVTIHHLDGQPILSIRRLLPRTELPAFIRTSLMELAARSRLIGAAMTGPPMVLYHASGPSEVDAEVCVPVVEGVAASGAISARVLPARTVARLVHVGPYDGLPSAHAAVASWIAEHDLARVGPNCERYLTDPGAVASPLSYRTEVEIPIAAAPVAIPA